MKDMKKNSMEKFEWPNLKDLLAVAGLVFAGFFMGFSYFIIGPLLTLAFSFMMIFLIAVVIKYFREKGDSSE